jgi:peptidyl-prolyl cis-trans isomerase-like 6
MDSRLIRKFFSKKNNQFSSGGDIQGGRGNGGESIYGETFHDETFVVKHNQRGILG